MLISPINSYNTNFNGGFTKTAETEIRNALQKNIIKQGNDAYKSNAKLLRTVLGVKQNPQNYLIDINVIKDKFTRLINVTSDKYVSESYSQTPIRMPSRFSPVTLFETFDLTKRKHCIPYVEETSLYNKKYIEELNEALLPFCKEKNSSQEVPNISSKESYIDYLKSLVTQRWGSKCSENNHKENDLLNWLFK